MAFILKEPDEFEAYRKRREAEKKLEADMASGQAIWTSGAADAGNTKTGPARKFAAGLAGVLALAGFVSLFVMSFLLSDMLESMDLEWLLIFGFGATFLFFGIAILASGAGNLSWIFILVGLVIAAVSAAFGIGNDALREYIMSDGVPLLAGAGFGAAGLGMIFLPGISGRRNKARYTIPVTARVVDKIRCRSRGDSGRMHISYYLTWQYSVNGRTYTYRSNFGRSPEKRDVGHVGQLWLDPGRPERVWEGDDPASRRLFMLMGLVFLASGILVILLVTGVIG